MVMGKRSVVCAVKSSSDFGLGRDEIILTLRLIYRNNNRQRGSPANSVP